MTVSGYTLQDYGEMIKCEPRISAFAAALKQSITPGCHVIDLGAGPGHFGLLACLYGAGHATIIEPDKTLHIARQAAQDNGFADRVTFVEDISQNWKPDRKADVVISDIRGVMPLFQHHIPTIQDVRARLLKPGGTQIPGVDRIYAALVHAPDTYAKAEGPWRETPFGVDMTAAHVYAINKWSRTYLSPDALASTPQLFTTLDYTSITATSHRATLNLEATDTRTVHGVLLWFETELVPGIGYSNAPGEPEQVYGQAFFPLESPVALAKGATAQVNISANFIDNDYVWNWNFAAEDTSGQKHAFRQSSFKSDIIVPDMLQARAATFCPPKSASQDIDIYCLSCFDGQTDLNAVAEKLLGQFPQHFKDAASALNHAAKLSAKYHGS